VAGRAAPEPTFVALDLAFDDAAVRDARRCYLRIVNDLVERDRVQASEGAGVDGALVGGDGGTPGTDRSWDAGIGACLRSAAGSSGGEAHSQCSRDATIATTGRHTQLGARPSVAGHFGGAVSPEAGIGDGGWRRARATRTAGIAGERRRRASGIGHSVPRLQVPVFPDHGRCLRHRGTVRKRRTAWWRRRRSAPLPLGRAS
jgi:hypothetical protein